MKRPPPLPCFRPRGQPLLSTALTLGVFWARRTTRPSSSTGTPWSTRCPSRSGEASWTWPSHAKRSYAAGRLTEAARDSYSDLSESWVYVKEPFMGISFGEKKKSKTIIHIQLSAHRLRARRLVVFAFLFCLLTSEQIRVIKARVSGHIHIGKMKHSASSSWDVRRVPGTWFLGSGWMLSTSKSCGVWMPLSWGTVGAAFQSTRSFGWGPCCDNFCFKI